MTVSESLVVLRKDAEEDNNWRSARTKMIEVLESLQSAESRLQAIVTDEANLRASCATLNQQRDDLNATMIDLRGKIARFADDLAEKQKLEQAALADVRAAREAEEQKLADVQEKLGALKKQLN